MTDAHGAARAPSDPDALRKNTVAQVSALADALTDSVHHGVVEVFENQKQVESAARELHETSTAFRERTNAWATSLEAFDKELRDIGDFENWVKAMEHDLATLATALEAKVNAKAAKAAEK